MRRLLSLLPLLWLAVLLLLCPPVGAETRYVSDQLYISLRDNPDPNATLLTTLRTDTPLEVLGEEGEFLRVRTPDGTEGFVLSRYVTSALPKPLQLERLRQERDELRQRVAELEAQDENAAVREAEKEAAAWKERAKTLEADLEEARRQLAAVREQWANLQRDAADVVALVNDRERLQARNEQLATEVETLREENEGLLKTGMISWFLAGGGVFFGGWLAGKMSRKKRRSF